jgi:2-polyprenyl-3-methyl-5-hydroxy-6-metoxy-1,4-benzoquinol methylase
MKIVLTLLVRDEVDIIDAMLRAHFALGVDFVIATDNRSVDGTADILRHYERRGLVRVIDEPGDDYRQAEWVTRMARLAATEHQADWVINADADEFWWPTEGDLHEVLASVPDDISVVEAARNNFVIRPDDDEPFHRRMRWRRTDSLTENGVTMGPKACHRAAPLVEVAMGNHLVTGLPGGVLADGRIEVLHFPLRSLRQYAGKIAVGAAALERNVAFSAEVGSHWRAAADLQRQGGLDAAWASYTYDDARLARELASGEVVLDERVAALVSTGGPATVAPMSADAPSGPSSTAASPTSSSSDLPPVRQLGEGVTYADGAEDQLLGILRDASDRSSDSDELDAEIVDWPTRYHLSHQRANLLRPLRIDATDRVLDVGAGTGTIARYLGEKGASVLALEGNGARAQAAAVRCADLPSVEVACGALDDLDTDDQFDLVSVIGVLEYAGSAIGGAGGPEAMLARVRQLVADDGVVVLAIENQIGLKYLLGGPEDHLGRPWVGIEDYPGRPGVRTWTRCALGAMLAHAGFAAQRWLAPFPDYKLPSTVVHEHLYDRVDAVDVVDQLLLHPVSALDHQPVRLSDPAAAQRVFVEAGVGLEVANSFLVVAGADDDAVAGRVPDDIDAWLYGGHRRSAWRRHRALTVDDRLVPLNDTEPRAREWLSQVPGPARSFEPGRTLGQLATEAARAHDFDALASVLDRWRDELLARAVDVEPATAGAHPFLPEWSRRGLPDGYLDVSLTNFVDRDGTLVLIDDEWRTGAPVDLHIALLRALWVFAYDLVTSGVDHPWGEMATIESIHRKLADLADVELDERALHAWRAAEVELQELVAGEPEYRVREGWLDGSTRSFDLAPDRLLDAERQRLAQGNVAWKAEVLALQERLAEVEDERAEFQGQSDHLAGVVAGLEAELDRLRTPSGLLHALGRSLKPQPRD